MDERDDSSSGRVLIFAGENPDDVRSSAGLPCRSRWTLTAYAIDVHFIPGALQSLKNGSSRIRSEEVTSARRRSRWSIIDTTAAYFEGDDENEQRASWRTCAHATPVD